jgi:hypothetical protein
LSPRSASPLLPRCEVPLPQRVSTQAKTEWFALATFLHSTAGLARPSNQNWIFLKDPPRGWDRGRSGRSSGAVKISVHGTEIGLKAHS